MFNLRRRLMMSGSGEYEQIVNYAFLYNEGDECSDLTWGWETRAWSFDSTSSPKAVTLTKNKHYMSGSIAGSSAYVSGVIQTGMEIDLYEYDNMYVDFSATGGTETKGYDYLDIYVGDRESSYYYSPEKLIGRLLDLRWNASQSNTVSRRTLKGDISQFNSWHDIYIGFYSYQATISANIYNIYLTKPDDWEKLCNLAGVTPPSTLNELISDTTALNTIFNNERAVNFMLLQCTGDFMVSVLSNEIAVNRLKDSQYLNEIIANVHWAKFMMIIPTAKSILNYTMLYDEGDECTDVTGGLSTDGYTIKSGYTVATATKNEDNIYVSYVNGKAYLIGMQSPITVDEYSIMGAVTMVTGNLTNTSGTHGIDIKLHVTKHVNDEKALLRIGTPLNEKTLKFIDIKSIYGSYYMEANSGLSNQCHGYIYNVFLAKSDNYKILCSKAGITAPSDLATLIADTSAIATIMSNEEAVKYLMGCTGDLMVAICNSETAMNILANSIAFDYAVNHPVWYKFMRMCPTSYEYVKTITYLYNEGDECEEITGGWNSVIQTTGTNYISTGLTIKRNSDNLEISISTSGSKNRCGIWHMNNKVDFSKYRKLCGLVKGTGSNSNGNSVFGAVELVNSDGSMGTVLANTKTIVSDYTLFEVDLSSVNSEGCVYGTSWAAGGYSASIFIKEVWLEE